MFQNVFTHNRRDAHKALRSLSRKFRESHMCVCINVDLNKLKLLKITHRSSRVLQEWQWAQTVLREFKGLSDLSGIFRSRFCLRTDPLLFLTASEKR